MIAHRFAILLGVALLGNDHAAEAGIHLAGCGPMRVAWEFESTASVDLQFWSGQSDRWMTLIESGEAKGAVQDVEMDDGSWWLPKATYYRARLCDPVSCEEAPMAWIPAYVCPEERHKGYATELMEPIEIRRRFDGTVRTVSVNPGFPQRLKIIQYNAYASSRANERWETPFPPMQKPPYVDDKKATVGDMVRFNVWFSHEAKQTGEPPDVTGTGFEEILQRVEQSEMDSTDPEISYPGPGQGMYLISGDAGRG